MKQTILKTLSLAACAFIASPVVAQKYKTDIPPSVITPDTVVGTPSCR